LQLANSPDNVGHSGDRVCIEAEEQICEVAEVGNPCVVFKHGTFIVEAPESDLWINYEGRIQMNTGRGTPVLTP
jgi:hypothetical protein